ncbi:MAG TPA: TetR/AcrR family transcriptional regulator [Pseudonocardia sp.]
MARKRSLDGGQDIAEQILDRAALLFYERGYDATSIRDLAEAIGISSSTLYHHYSNKQEILYAVVHRFMEVFNAEIIPTLSDPGRSPTARLLDAVRLHLEISDARRAELLRVNHIRASLNEPQVRELTRLQWAYQDAVKNAIKEGCAAGEIATDDVDLCTMAVLDMLNGVRTWFRHSGSLSLNDVVARYTAMVRKMLSTP